MSDRACNVEGCQKPTRPQKRKCSMHLARLHKYGSTELPPRQAPSAAERFWAKVAEGPGDCWSWTAASYKGYGQFGLDRSSVAAHRWAYEQMVGEIPNGLTLDHLCRNRACVNPDHLDPVPQSVNAARGNSGPNHHAGKTHCKRGHEFTLENTGRTTTGSRYCRVCMRAHNRAWQQRRRAA